MRAKTELKLPSGEAINQQTAAHEGDINVKDTNTSLLHFGGSELVQRESNKEK